MIKSFKDESNNTGNTFVLMLLKRVRRVSGTNKMNFCISYSKMRNIVHSYSMFLQHKNCDFSKSGHFSINSVYI